MKKFRLSLSIISLLLWSNMLYASQGTYVGFQLGPSWLSTPTSRQERVNKGQGADLLNHNRRTFMWGLLTGYSFPITPHFSLAPELSYNNDGATKITYASNNRYKFTEYDIALLANAIYMFSNNISLFVKSGFSYAHETYKNTFKASTSTSTDPTSSKSGYFPVVAAGTSYTFAKHYNVFIMYRHLFAKNQRTITDTFGPRFTDPSFEDRLKNVASTNSVTVGFTYLFF